MASRSKVKKHFRIGDRVSLAKTGHQGKVAYEGKVKFRPGHWIGVVLDRAVGLNNGMVKGVRYFECKPRCGIFVPASALRILERKEPTKRPQLRSAAQKKQTRSNSAQSIKQVRRTPLAAPKVTRSSSTIAKTRRTSLKSPTSSDSRKKRTNSRPKGLRSPRGASPSARPQTSGSKPSSRRPSKNNLLIAKQQRHSRSKSEATQSSSSSINNEDVNQNSWSEETVALKKEVESLRKLLLDQKGGAKGKSGAKPQAAKKKKNEAAKQNDQHAGESSSAQQQQQTAGKIQELEASLAAAKKDFSQAAEQLERANERIYKLQKRAEDAEQTVKDLNSKIDDIKSSYDAKLKNQQKQHENTQRQLQQQKQQQQRRAGPHKNKTRSRKSSVPKESKVIVKKKNASVATETSSSTSGDESVQKRKVKELEKALEDQKALVLDKEKKITRIIAAAEEHALLLQKEIRRKQEHIDTNAASTARLKHQLTESQKKANKLVHQNKKLRIKASGRHSQKQGKLALAQFQRLDLKIKDLEFQLFYGATKKDRELQNLVREREKMESTLKSESALRAHVEDKVKDLEEKLKSFKESAAKAWLFSGDMELEG
mmetsp:Transcript_6150/g.11358  ORF Transcript_6150/g.11358 Transcript_6150/m.11358 type:complete len:598 (+) Transcript_6150:96-1889(+)|eukprot:CAMPEP_0197518568 /NCGR_PEP_ID=MMETSP1318-20131121/3784_1 /TAXON_ID=552666 /ORGANISM="Partenskyella glossopodia, Strain RCC365" /LENGTH=597 /DNA_ID=CAMNT_0043069017 /DNA_START=40 /DNA_END=1833 /DNA_ORIENTATION=-